MVTFDVKSTPRPETEEMTSDDGMSFVDDTVTISSEIEPSVMLSGDQTLQPSKSFITLKPTEQVMHHFDGAFNSHKVPGRDGGWGRGGRICGYRNLIA